jgi:nucleoside-diphosphate-sugar epimerase
MSKIFVSGAGGYVGVPLCTKLVERGHSVIALDRYFFGKMRIDGFAASPLATIVVDDIRAFDPKILHGVDTVVDLAGLSNDASAEINPDLTRSINFEGGVRLARLAKEAGISRYVYSSSASVYGHGTHEQLTENDECRPLTLYAECKLQVEKLLGSMTDSKFETVIFRNATVFGLSPRMRFDLAVNIMTLRAWKERNIYIMGGGDQWRPFVHVSDVVRALIHGIEDDGKRVAGQIFNVGGDGMNYRIRQLAEFVRDVVPNTTVHWIPDDPDKRTYNVSFAKIRKYLDFEPAVRVHEGIVEIKQALDRGACSGDDPTFYTLQWYRSLLDWERRIKELSLRGQIL